MTGLARDRGLFVPDEIPQVTTEEVESWRTLSFPDVAINVISKFVQDDQVPTEKLEDIVRRSCAAFRHEDVTPVIEVAGHQVLVRPNKCGTVRGESSDQMSLLLACTAYLTLSLYYICAP
jgi:hypothetical protein